MDELYLNMQECLVQLRTVSKAHRVAVLKVLIENATEALDKEGIIVELFYPETSGRDEMNMYEKLVELAADLEVKTRNTNHHSRANTAFATAKLAMQLRKSAREDYKAAEESCVHLARECREEGLIV
jgi:hypothetical protein